MHERLTHILLLEDNPADARLLQEILRDAPEGRFEVRHAARLSEALDLLRDGQAYDVILLDLTLPDSAGIDTVSRVREAAPHVPLVVLTGMEDEALGLEAMRRGAQDYLMKAQVEPRLLARALTYAVERGRIEQERRRALEDLSRAQAELRGQNEELAALREAAERRAAEAEEGRRILNALMEHIPEGITLADADGRVRMISRYGQALTGRSLAELTEKPIGQHADRWQLYEPDGVTPASPDRLPLVRALRAGEAVLEEELVLRRPDGRDVPLLCSAAPIRDAQGRVTAGIVAWRDIAERKRAESERERHLGQHRRLFEVSRGVLSETSVEGLLRRVVDAARVLTGARLSVSGHGYCDGRFRVGVMSRDSSVPGCPPEAELAVERGGVYQELIDGRDTLRLSDAELRAHPRWRGLPEGHCPLRGLLGAQLVGPDEEPSGIIMVSDRADGGDFTAEDEVLLGQLAALASLGLRHVQARADAERRADELDALFAALVQPVVLYDRAGRVIRANPAALRLVGQERPGPLRQPLLEPRHVRHLDGRPMPQEEMPSSRALRGETVSPVTVAARFDDGREVTLLVSASPLLADGKVVGAVLACQDVTERERLVEALETERARLRAIFDNAPEGILVVDDQCRVVLANPVAESLYGRPVPHGADYPAHEAMRIAHPDGVPYDARDLPLTRSAMDGETQRDVEAAIVWPDGQRRDLLINCAPIHDGHGRRTGAVAVFQDITGRKQADRERQDLLEALSRARDELEVRVWQRTAELSSTINALQGEVVERTRAQQELRVVNKALQMHVECNQALVRAGEEGELLRDVCRIITDIGGYRMAWVGLAEQGSDRRIRPAAVSGFEDGYLRQVPITWADTPEGRGPSGRAIRGGEPVVCRNVQADPSFAPWCQHALQRGYYSCIAIPLRGRGQPFGVLGIYSSHVDAFGEAEAKLLVDLAEDLTFGVAALRAQARRREAERALRDSEQRFRQFAEVVPEVFWIQSAETGEVLYVNPVFELVWGRPAAELYRDAGVWLAGIHEDDRRRAIDARQRLLASDGAEPFDEEYRVVRPDGSQRLVRSRAFPIRDGRGRVARVCGVVEDVTERRQAEEARLRLAAIVESSDDAMFSMSLDGTLTSWNAGAERLYGYTADEIVGRPMTLLVPRERRRELSRILRTLRHGGSIHHLETVRLKSDGRPIEVSLTMSPIRDAAGRVIAISGVGRDITERKRLEREVLEIGEMERQRIGQDLHDTLGQNLTGVAIMTKVLQQKLTAKALAEAREAASLASHVNAAIALTRSLARGLCPVELKAEGLADALEDLVSRSSDVLGVQCRFECRQSVFVRTAATVATHLYHIAQEAISNAVKHGQARGVLVRLSRVRDQIVLSIRDDGVGMPAELPADRGMGLRIMGYRAKMIGGTLDLRRSARGGTVVRCIVPAETPVEAEQV